MTTTATATPVQPPATGVEIVVPVYKPMLEGLEALSVEHSLGVLAAHPVTFIHPAGLDLGYYRETFPAAKSLALPREFFASHRNYNQLCYENGFYSQFLHSSHMLLLQPDAIVLRNDLARWCASRYDFIGGPEGQEYCYDLRGIAPFTGLASLAPVRLHGCNGGLSLRRVAACIDALTEYPALTTFFRSYGVGIGEDVFFSLVGRVSTSFQVANEITAAKFALTDHFAEWLDLTAGALPMGLHGWFKKDADREFLSELLARVGGVDSRRLQCPKSLLEPLTCP